MPPKTNPTVDPLSEKKKIILARLTCSEQDVAAILVDTAADKFNYEVELIEVETLGRDIHQLQHAVLSSCAETEIVAVAQEFTVLLKRFKILKSQLLRFLTPPTPVPHEPLAVPAGGGDTAAPVQQVPNVKLPKLELPQFKVTSSNKERPKDQNVQGCGTSQ